MLAIIVAVGRNGEIGAGSDLPWGRRLPADLNYFKETTLNKTVIMGLKTFESLNFKPLPGRENIILTQTPLLVEGIKVAKNLQEAFEMAEHKDIFVSGGGSVYAKALPLVEYLYLTEVDATFSNADVFFPSINFLEWEEISRTHKEADKDNAYSLNFVVYKRVKITQLQEL